MTLHAEPGQILSELKAVRPEHLGDAQTSRRVAQHIFHDNNDVRVQAIRTLAQHVPAIARHTREIAFAVREYKGEPYDEALRAFGKLTENIPRQGVDAQWAERLGRLTDTKRAMAGIVFAAGSQRQGAFQDPERLTEWLTNHIPRLELAIKDPNRLDLLFATRKLKMRKPKSAKPTVRETPDESTNYQKPTSEQRAFLEKLGLHVPSSRIGCRNLIDYIQKGNGTRGKTEEERVEYTKQYHREWVGRNVTYHGLPSKVIGLVARNKIDADELRREFKDLGAKFYTPHPFLARIRTPEGPKTVVLSQLQLRVELPNKPPQP